MVDAVEERSNRQNEGVALNLAWGRVQDRWLKEKSGQKIKSTQGSGSEDYPVLDSAPGLYVLEK